MVHLTNSSPSAAMDQKQSNLAASCIEAFPRYLVRVHSNLVRHNGGNCEEVVCTTWYMWYSLCAEVIDLAKVYIVVAE
jgi:hypothetical protein